MTLYDIKFRPYDFDNDPKRIVKHLYRNFNSHDGIDTLHREDRIFLDKPHDNIRFVAEINNELHSSLVLMRSKDPTMFTLYSLVTSEEMRGLGLATALFGYSKVWIRLQSGLIVSASTALDNHSAQRFFSANDFRQIEHDNKEIYYEYSMV